MGAFFFSSLTLEFEETVLLLVSEFFFRFRGLADSAAATGVPRHAIIVTCFMLFFKFLTTPAAVVF